MQKPRKIPQRQCVGCREMKEKKALLRIVRTPEGEVLLDMGGAEPERFEKNEVALVRLRVEF